MTRAQVLVFDWSFLEEVCRWALAVALAVSIVGAAVTHDARFAAACIVAAGVDIALVEFSVRRARRELDADRIDAVAPTVMLAGRLVVKAGLLVLAFFVHETAVFAGAVAGVLIFDLTLALGGSVIAMRGIRNPREGG